MRICKTCPEQNPECFGKLKKSSDGLRSECKSCRNKKSRDEYIIEPQLFLDRKNKWKRENLDAYKESTHLRPYDAIENIKKGNKINDDC